MNPVSVTVLGSGDAFASGGRFNSGYIVDANGRLILMEAGPMVLASLKRARIAPADLGLVLISHLHGDHFGGLPFLILEYIWESRLRRKLTIAGPPHLEERTWKLFRTMYPGAKTERVADKLDFIVLKPGDNARLGKTRVSTIRTPHTRRDISLAFRITVGGRTIVFSGDSGWTDDFISFSDGADLFLCECTYFGIPESNTHMSYPVLAANRERLNVGRIVLTHLGREVLERRSDVEMEMARDGMKIRL